VADRTVSARLRLDVAGYLVNARAARAATRQIADEADRAGRRTGASVETNICPDTVVIPL
jgi:hypothetical protein